MAKKKATQKLERVEISIERVDHDQCQFYAYREKSNRTFFRSQVYSARSSSIRGAKRKALSEGWKIVRWLK